MLYFRKWFPAFKDITLILALSWICYSFYTSNGNTSVEGTAGACAPNLRKEIGGADLHLKAVDSSASSPALRQEMEVLSPPILAGVATILPRAAPSSLPVASAPIFTGKKQQMIFVLGMGRTGTSYLSTVLKCVMEPMYSRHEPKPFLVYFPELAQVGREATYAKRRDEKLPAVQESLAHMERKFGPGAVYAEISHMFGRAWGDVLLDWLEEVDPLHERYDVHIINLKRYLPSVVRSYLASPKMWATSRAIDQWNLQSPYSLHHRGIAILEPLQEYHAADSVDMILGFLFDMEQQYTRFIDRYQWPHYLQLRSEEMFSKVGSRRLLKTLGLTPDEECLADMKKENTHLKDEVTEVPDEVFLARALLFQDSYRQAGLAVPQIPTLQKVKQCEGDPEGLLPWCTVTDPPLMNVEAARALVQNLTEPIPGNSEGQTPEWIANHGVRAEKKRAKAQKRQEREAAELAAVAAAAALAAAPAAAAAPA